MARREVGGVNRAVMMPALVGGTVAVRSLNHRLGRVRIRRSLAGPESGASLAWAALLPERLRVRMARVWTGPAELDRILARMVVGTVAASAVALVVGPLVSALVVALSPAALLFVANRHERRARRACDDAVADLATGVAGRLRSGDALVPAIAATADGLPPELGREIRAVVHEVRSGRPLEECLRRWERARPGPGVRLVSASVLVASEVGGGEAATLEGVAEVLRHDREIAGQIRALSSQAWLSAIVVSVSPLVFAALAAAADPRVGAFLFRSPAGAGVLVGGLALDAVGIMWMRRLARIEV